MQRPIQRLSVVPLWAWWLVAVAAATGLTLLAKGGGRAFEFVDSDDALRLVQVRELLAGAAWYPVETKVLGGAEGLVSHWSRLIDAPMALLLGGLQLMLPEPFARNALVTIWPMLLLAALLWAIGRSTLQAHDRLTAVIALALGASSLVGYYQFAPGRIDHHNVMIVSTVAAALIMWAAPNDSRAWRWAGALCALALAVGYEALAPVAVLSALAGGWGLLDRRMAASAGCFVVGFVSTLVLAFVVTVPPAHWPIIHCDALSLDMVLLALSAGTGFVLVMRHGAAWSWPLQAVVLAASGGIGLGILAWLEPACLGGPMGQVPKALWPIWIDHVEEARSLVGDLLRGKIAAAIVPVLVLVVGLATAVTGLVRSERPADRFLAAATFGFVVLALWQMKYTAYASFVLAPGIAVLIARLPKLGDVTAPVVRGLAVVILNQFVLFALAMSLKGALSPAAGKGDAAQSAYPVTAEWACTRADALAALGQVSPGLVVSHSELGSHLAATTHHRALAGPYHRIPDAIVANHGILRAGDHATAGRLLAAAGADYILGCTPIDSILAARAAWSGTMLADLAAGRTPPYLVPVPLAGAPIYRLWRVDRAKLPQ